MTAQLELPIERRRFTGYEAVIDWDAVSGIDLATNDRLLQRWFRSPERAREYAQLRAGARRIRARRRAALAAAEISRPAAPVCY